MLQLYDDSLGYLDDTGTGDSVTAIGMIAWVTLTTQVQVTMLQLYDDSLGYLDDTGTGDNVTAI